MYLLIVEKLWRSNKSSPSSCEDSEVKNKMSDSVASITTQTITTVSANQMYAVLLGDSKS